MTDEATHSYFGGFLKHTINVANLADMALTICEGSPNEVIRPDSSLVIAGALLHASGVLSQLTLGAAEGILTERARLLASSTDAVLMAVCTNSRLEQEKRVTDMSALLHILEAANGMTPPKIQGSSYCHQRSTDEQRAEFYRSDLFPSLTVCIRPIRPGKLSATIWAMTSFEEERNV